MEHTRVMQIVKEEVDSMFTKAQKNSPKIERELEKLRKKLFKDEPVQPEKLGTETFNRPEKRMALDLVAEMLNVQINELLLYFLNCVKTKNERSLVEMRLGHVYFYGE